MCYSSDEYTFGYCIGSYRGTVQASTVKQALNRAKCSYINRANQYTSKVLIQSLANRIQDKDVCLVCDSASTVAVTTLHRNLSELVTEEGRDNPKLRAKLKRLESIHENLSHRN